MAVDGVNSRNNSGYYALSAAAIGGGAGIGAAYLTKPFLKNDAPIDEFIKKVEESNVESLNTNLSNAYKKSKSIVEEVNQIANAEELKKFITGNESIKAADELLASAGKQTYLQALETQGFEKVKSMVKTAMETCHDVDRKNMYRDIFQGAFDSDKKEFVHDASKISKEGFEAVKSAAKSIQGKYAMIYGAIGAAVLGLGALLFSGSKSDETQA